MKSFWLCFLFLDTGDAFTEALHERKNILLHCLDGNVDREKEALYALQFLMHKLQHPNSKHILDQATQN